jgi:predicted ABC-type ATPase
MPDPVITLISGPNGAGKTTTAFSIMPELIDCDEYVNADEIAAGLSPFRPQSVSMEAGRLMLDRIHNLSNQKNTFAFETTLASRSFAPFLVKCKEAGYSIRLIYMWLSSVELAIERVKRRVASGGHNVPEDIIRRRFDRSLGNFFKLYMPIADSWAFYDNSLRHSKLIAESENEEITIYNLPLWISIQAKVRNEQR